MHRRTVTVQDWVIFRQWYINAKSLYPRLRMSGIVDKKGSYLRISLIF